MFDIYMYRSTVGKNKPPENAAYDKGNHTCKKQFNGTVIVIISAHASISAHPSCF